MMIYSYNGKVVALCSQSLPSPPFRRSSQRPANLLGLRLNSNLQALGPKDPKFQADPREENFKRGSHQGTRVATGRFYINAHSVLVPGSKLKSSVSP